MKHACPGETAPPRSEHGRQQTMRTILCNAVKIVRRHGILFLARNRPAIRPVVFRATAGHDEPLHPARQCRAREIERRRNPFQIARIVPECPVCHLPGTMQYMGWSNALQGSVNLIAFKEITPMMLRGRMEERGASE